MEVTWKMMIKTQMLDWQWYYSSVASVLLILYRKDIYCLSEAV